MNAENNKKNNRRWGVIILLVLLLGANAFLIFRNLDSSKQNKALLKENIELKEDFQNEKDDLFSQMDSLSAMLEKEKGSNVELNARLTKMQSDLEAEKERLKKEMQNKDYSIAQLRKKLTDAENKLETMETRYLATIDSLTNQVTILTGENTAMRDTVAGQKVKIKEMDTKISRGEALIAADISATGVRYKRNGVEKSEDKAKDVDKIKVCFDIINNRVADPGPNDMLVKIISPEGSTLMVESLGSGTFTVANSGKTSLYTTKETINYEPDDENSYCLFWSAGTIPFAEGIYNIEIYNKGYLSGSTQLKLK